jgi:hypothetical protein
MAILMVCTCGQEMVTEDEHAGRKVRCPICKSIVVIPGVRRASAGPVAAARDIESTEEDEDDYRSRREGGLSKRDRLARARIGIGLHWGKTLCFLILSALGLLGSLTLLITTIAASTRSAVIATDSSAGVFTVVRLLGCLGAIAFMVMPVLAAVGSLMCFWLPQRSGGRVLSMVACGLDTGAFFLLLVTIIMFFAGVGSAVNRGLSGATFENLFMMGGFVMVLVILMYLLLLAGWILHMLVMKNLAEYTRYHRTASDVVRMLVIGLVTLIVPGLVIWIFSQLVPRIGIAGVYVIEFMYIAWTGGLLGVSFKLLNLTSSVRRLL